MSARTTARTVAVLAVAVVLGGTTTLSASVGPSPASVGPSPASVGPSPAAPDSGTSQADAPPELALPASSPPPVPGWPAPPQLAAPSFLLVDGPTGQVLAARAAGTARPVASTVKMLTALTVRRLLPDADRVIELGQEVARVGGASTGLAPGDSRTVRQLLDALLVRSGNDAAVALAVAAAGSVDAFVEQMLLDATALGLPDLVLRSPSGLQDRNLLAATDLATIALALLDDPLLRRIVDQPTVRLPGLGAVPNRNELVLDDPSVTGIKTGFTTAAGNGVVASARRGDRPVVAVVLGAEDPSARFADAAALLQHAGRFAPADLPGPTVIGCPGPDARAAGASAPLVVPREADVDGELTGAGCSTPAAVLALRVGRVVLRVEEVAVRAPAEPLQRTAGTLVAGAVQRALRAAPPQR